ncbi:MAG: acyl-CoA reductase [Oscillospiraceae bacterium]
MNLIQGQLMTQDEATAFLQQMPDAVANTLQKPPLQAEVVVEACQALANSVLPQDFAAGAQALGVAPQTITTYYEELKTMFSSQYLYQRLKTELGDDYNTPQVYTPNFAKKQVHTQYMPLGVLLHIAAGNMDGLPVYSVIEGLLAGNVNILKLPQVDGGLTIQILQKLFLIQPLLAQYVYVFDYSSKETEALTALANIADAVVVWGGDEAVSAFRKMAQPNTRIIEWGHKSSFAYVTKAGMQQNQMQGLAYNICQTNQLLCSSCQGIFVDTEDINEAGDFCKQFLPVLQQQADKALPIPLSALGQTTLKLYNEELETIYKTKVEVFKGNKYSVLLYPGQALTVSMQFRNPWVRALPRSGIVKALHPYKNHLQTAGLLCGDEERMELAQLLWQAGVVRVAGGENMSDTFCGAPHDGEYPLRRYSRMVSLE